MQSSRILCNSIIISRVAKYEHTFLSFFDRCDGNHAKLPFVAVIQPILGRILYEMTSAMLIINKSPFRQGDHKQ
jgi:hypothetical protein